MFFRCSTKFNSCLIIRPPVRAFASLRISPRVQHALSQGLPVVCLESTIITHGMSYPANLAMAKAVERIVEENGATPATIAILDGQARVGLELSDLEALAMVGRKARKVSRRDLASAIADKATGGTTVSGTMILAKKAGIKVFVTGGIGGVHRNAEVTMDISNDLEELSRNDCAVVCAGPKAVLDIPRTLEYLETQGVTVTTLGQDNLPAFYSRDSGICSPQTCKSTEDAAKLILANLQLRLNSSVLVCVPIPEEASLDPVEMNLVIRMALIRAKELGIEGKDTTPFLLEAIATSTEGRSLEANIALVKENARVGARIACHLAELSKAVLVNGNEVGEEVPRSSVTEALRCRSRGLSPFTTQDEPSTTLAISEKTNNVECAIIEPEVLVIGGVALDTVANIGTSGASRAELLRTSHPGRTTRSVGGVAGNIARAIARTGTSAVLASIVGTTGNLPDPEAIAITTQLGNDGVKMHIAEQEGFRTATYTSIQASGDLIVAVADMAINEYQGFSLQSLSRKVYQAIILDSNIPTAFRAAREAHLQAELVCFEPTSVPKSRNLFRNIALGNGPPRTIPLWPDNFVTMSTPNLYELRAMFEAAQSEGILEGEEWWSVINSLNITSVFRLKIEQFLRSHENLRDLQEVGAVQQAINLLPLLGNIYLTLGRSGVLSFHLGKIPAEDALSPDTIVQQGVGSALTIIYHAPIPGDHNVVSDTGCGDTFTGVLVSSIVHGNQIRESVERAQRAAILTLQSGDSVSPAIGRFAS